MLITKEVKTKWCSKNKEHYIKKGYVYTGNLKEFDCKVDDLPENSHIKVKYFCDYCLEEGIETILETTYQKYLHRRKSLICKDCCKKHSSLKTKESNLKKYGVENVFQLEEINLKKKETNIEKYGCEYASSSKEIREKVKKTCLDKYGVDNVSKSKEVVDKILNTHTERYGKFYTLTEEYAKKRDETLLKKYGTTNVMEVEEIREKIKNTMIERYGTDNIANLDFIKNKKMKTLAKNGKVNTSRQQKYLHNLFGGKINYTDSSTRGYSLDIAFPNEKIYIEYDGGMHNACVKLGYSTQKEFEKRELDRYFYLKSQGWKMIKIISERDYLPSDKILLDELKKAKKWLSINKKNHYHYNILIGNYANDEKYGKLRKIKEKDIIRENNNG